MVVVPLPRVFGRRALLLVFCGLGLVLGGTALARARATRVREVRREVVELREQACACTDRTCAIRAAKRLYRVSPLDEAGERAQIDGFLCLTRFSDTCTLGDLIWNEEYERARLRGRRQVGRDGRLDGSR